MGVGRGEGEGYNKTCPISGNDCSQIAEINNSCILECFQTKSVIVFGGNNVTQGNSIFK